MRALCREEELEEEARECTVIYFSEVRKERFFLKHHSGCEISALSSPKQDKYRERHRHVIQQPPNKLKKAISWRPITQ